MKIMATSLIGIIISFSCALSAQESPVLQAYWQIGIGLGELPVGGSFKPSITIGYQFNDKLYMGVIYQFRDQISRNESSFNAQSTGLEGLKSSSEEVAQRFLLHLRYTPVKKGPYLSGGLVFNGEDSESMWFDGRNRIIDGQEYNGDIQVIQTRPAGWGLALGLGYQYNFRNGFSAGFEWTPAWFQYPVPTYSFSGSANLSSDSEQNIREDMTKGFNSSVTNMYKVFHIGVAYRFH